MVKKTRQKSNDIIRSSAAEYLTFVAASGKGGKEDFELRYENENIWLSQKMMAALYGVSVAAINQHIKKIFEDKELTEAQTIKKYLIVQDEGGTAVRRNVVHYNLQMIIAVGFKVNNERAVAFRKWANHIVKGFNGSEILMGAGKISAEEAKLHAESQFEKYRVVQDRLYESDFDRFLAEEGKKNLDELEDKSRDFVKN